MKYLAIVLSLWLVGCAQITYNVTVTGNDNKITSSGTVNKTTDDAVDLAGSGYGAASTTQGVK